MFWTRAILWKIIKVLEYLIGMVRYFPARKKYFFCPILDTSTCMPTYLLLQYGEIGNESKDITVPHGAFGYIGHNECINAYRIR